MSARSAVRSGEDRAGRRGRVAEALEVGFGERAFPGEGLAADEPGPVAVACRLGHLGQRGHHPLDVFESRHGGTLPPIVAVPALPATVSGVSRGSGRRRAAAAARTPGRPHRQWAKSRGWRRCWPAVATCTSRSSGMPRWTIRPRLQRDAIFRIASLTKPISAAGAMVLVDDGVLSLSDPVDALLPELAERRVLRSLESGARRHGPRRAADHGGGPFDLPSGLRRHHGAARHYPIQGAEAELGLMTLGPPWPPPPFGSDEWIARFATAAAAAPARQPTWRYNTGRAGARDPPRAGERAQPLETLPARQRLFEPLGMVDTSFSVPAEKQGRFTTAYMPDERRRAERAGPAGGRVVERAAGDGATRRACSSRRSTTSGPSSP